MKQTVTLADFREAFRVAERAYQFTYDGLEALFNMIQEFEQSTGEEIELDVIALCCEFTEYQDFEEVQQDYTHIETMEDLEDRALVYPFHSGLIVQNF